MRRFTGQFLALSLFTAAAHAGSLVTVYSNFSEDPGTGPGSYAYACSDAQCDNLFAYGVEWHQTIHWGGSTGSLIASSGAAQAMPFTVSGAQDLYLDELQLAMYKWPDDTPFDGAGDSIATNHDNLTIQLVTDSGGLPSSTVLETLAVNPAVAEDSETFLNLFSSSHPLLHAGQTYWVVVSPSAIDTASSSQDTMFGWMENQEDAQWNYTVNEWNPSYNGGLGAFQGFYSQSSSFTAPALNVLASTDLAPAVPEPATMALAGLALAGILARYKRRGR